MRLALGKRAKLDQIEHLSGTPLYLVLCQAFALEAKGDVFPGVQMREQRIGLEHHVDRPLVRRKLRHVLPAQQYAPSRGFFKPGQHAQQGGLAAA